MSPGAQGYLAGIPQRQKQQALPLWGRGVPSTASLQPSLSTEHHKSLAHARNPSAGRLKQAYSGGSSLGNLARLCFRILKGLGL